MAGSEGTAPTMALGQREEMGFHTQTPGKVCLEQQAGGGRHVGSFKTPTGKEGALTRGHRTT